MKKIKIDECFFIQPFARDADYDESESEYWLDKSTGEVKMIGLHTDEDEAEELRELIESDPERFLEIGGLSHGQQHQILQDFLDSNWSDDKDIMSHAKNAYCDSIGGWKEKVSTDTYHKYENYLWEQSKILAEEELKEHGIIPEWT